MSTCYELGYDYRPQATSDIDAPLSIYVDSGAVSTWEGLTFPDLDTAMRELELEWIPADYGAPWDGPL